MTKKELVRQTIAHDAPASVPYHIDLTPPVRDELAKHFGTDDVSEAIEDCLVIVGGSLGRPLYADPASDGALTEDVFGVLWRNNANDRGYVERHALNDPTLDGYEFPDPDFPGRFDAARDTVDAKRDLFVLGVAGDLFERANFMRGLDNLLMDMHLHPGFVHALLDGILEFDMATLRCVAGLGVDGIFISDDYGLQNQLMMRPDMWREFVRPRLNQLIDTAHSCGLPVALHSCGCVREIIPDLVDAGLDVLHPVQPEAMDVAEIKREFGRDLCLFGGLGTQRVLRNSSPDQVRDEVHRLQDTLGAEGGYILGPAITIQQDCPIDNILALIDAAQGG